MISSSVGSNAPILTMKESREVVTLPENAFLKILSYLGQEELAEAAAVSKVWNQGVVSMLQMEVGIFADLATRQCVGLVLSQYREVSAVDTPPRDLRARLLGDFNNLGFEMKFSLQKSVQAMQVHFSMRGFFKRLATNIRIEGILKTDCQLARLDLPPLLAELVLDGQREKALEILIVDPNWILAPTCKMLADKGAHREALLLVKEFAGWDTLDDELKEVATCFASKGHKLAAEEVVALIKYPRRQAQAADQVREILRQLPSGV